MQLLTCIQGSSLDHHDRMVFFYMMRRTYSYARVYKGSSLIEVLIAIFVIGMLVALYGVGVTALSLSREAAHKDIALHAASQQLETLRSGGYNSLPASGSFSNSQTALLLNGIGSTTISVYNSTTKKVDVSVLWREGKFGTTSVSISTLITQTGGLP